MKKAIITGATGFVGSNLCLKLVKDNWDVIIIVRPNSNLDALKSVLNKIEIFRYNNNLLELCEFFKIKKPDVVFHLASLFIAEHDLKDVDILIESNIRFGLHILEAMNASHTNNLINTGTSWQHYNSKKYNPVDLYAATKQAFEDIIKYYIDSTDLKAVTLKLFDTYGENDKRNKLVNILKNYASSENILELSPGYQEIDLIHIDDVIEAFIIASKYLEESFEKYSEFGIGTKKPQTLRKIVKIYEDIIGEKLNIKWGKREYRKREVMHTWKTYEILPNWIPKVNLEEGLKRIVK